MSSRHLFVLRMPPENAPAVADLFAAHDHGDMPRVVGVTRRTLFRFHDLYMHLVEGPDDILARLAAERQRPDFRDIDGKLNAYLQRYDPEGWRSFKDSEATPFYSWTP